VQLSLASQNGVLHAIVHPLNISAHVIMLTFYESGDNCSLNLCTLLWSLLFSNGLSH